MSAFDAYDACDGLILTSPEVYEPHAIAAMKAWFAESHRDVWAIGPLYPFPASKEAIAGEEVSSTCFKDVAQFLDAALVSHGEHSVLFVSVLEVHCCYDGCSGLWFLDLFWIYILA